VRGAVSRLVLGRPSQHARFDPVGHLVALAPGIDPCGLLRASGNRAESTPTATRTITLSLATATSSPETDFSLVSLWE
jgi:hypothetical protein